MNFKLSLRATRGSVAISDVWDRHGRPRRPREDTFMIVLLLSFFVVPYLNAQGFLPPKESSSTATTTAQGPLLIGEKVPESLVVLDENGKKRPLLSYKSAIEVMVLAVFSAGCPAKDAKWTEMARFYEEYKGWGVSFVAMNAGSPDSRTELAKTLYKEGLPILLVDSGDRSLWPILKVEYTPEVLIIDESGDLHYRGPVGKEARQAIEAVIGHMDPVPNPEPPQNGGCPLP